MATPVSSYTGMDVDGKVSVRTGMLTGITLAAGDRTLTRSEVISGVLVVTVGHATNAIVIPTVQATEFNEGGRATMLFIVRNQDATLAATIKVAGGTGIVVAATKTAIVMINPAGTDIVRVTADA